MVGFTGIEAYSNSKIKEKLVRTYCNDQTLLTTLVFGFRLSGHQEDDEDGDCQQQCHTRDNDYHELILLKRGGRFDIFFGLNWIVKCKFGGRQRSTYGFTLKVNLNGKTKH